MQAAHRVAKNTGILYARMAITVFISLYATRLVLAALGVADFGIFNLVGGAISMLTFLNVAMSTATQRFMSFAEGEGNLIKINKVFNVSLILHLLISIIVVVILEIGGYFLFNGFLKIPLERVFTAKLIYHFLVISTFFSIISVPYDAVINTKENMFFVAVLGIFEAIVKLLIALYVSYSSFDKLKIFGFLMASLSILLLFITWFYCQKKYKEVEINFKVFFDKTLFKEMSAHAGWSLLGSSASLLTMQGMSIVINSFFGVIVNAAQGISNQISGQLMAFSNTMLKALNPLIVKSEGANNRDKMLEAAMTGNKLSFFLLAYFAIPAIIEMPFILNLWLKNVPDYAIIFCRLNICRLMLSQLTISFPIAIGATNNIKTTMIVESMIYFLLLPISYFFFSMGAPPEVIYINLIFMVLALFVSRIYFMHTICGLSIKTFFQDVVYRCFFIAISVFCISTIPLFFIEDNLIRLIVVLIMSFSVCSIMLITVGLKRTEKFFLFSMLKNLKIKR